MLLPCFLNKYTWIWRGEMTCPSLPEESRERGEWRLSPTVPKSSEEEAPEGQGQALQRLPGECGPSAGQSQETCTPNPRIWPCEAG